MKMLFCLFCFAALFSKQAFASGTVCAGTSLHYSDHRADYGAPPPAGMYLGKKFLSHEGKLLAMQKRRVDYPAEGEWGIEVRMENKKLLASEGSEVYGSRVEEATLKVLKSEVVLFTERVICKKSWALVP